MINRISVKEFDKIIQEDRFTCITFSTRDCGACVKLKTSIEETKDLYPSISFYEMHSKQLDILEVVRRYRINMAPRQIFFKSGKEVGRMVGFKTPKELQKRFAELLNTGHILSTAEDTEEIHRFMNLTQKASNIDWKVIDKSKWNTQANKLMDLSYELITKNSDWSVLTLDQVRDRIAS